MHGSDAFTRGWITFAAMVVVLLAMQLWRRQPIGVALLFGAIAGGLVAGVGLPVRHLVEGAFTYFDPMLIIFTALIFMKVMEHNGALGSLARRMLLIFGHRPALLLIVVTLFIMFPGMLTGISTTSVLTTGALMATPLMALGIPRLKTAALILVVSIMGMIAPPINLIAMLIGQGVDMPYIGFDGILALLAFPPAIIAAFYYGYRHIRHGDPAAALATTPDPAPEYPLWKLYSPPLVVIVLMAGVRLFPHTIPDIGIPLIFIIGAMMGLFVGNRVKPLEVSYRALIVALPVLGLLAGIGMFLQIMTLTGVRGLLVVTVLGLPKALTYLGMAISLPVFGGVSAFASGMVFGIPILLSLLGHNEIIVGAALSMMAGLGDALPPSAIGARFAAQAVGEADYLRVTLKALPILLLALLMALGAVFGAGYLGWLTP